MTLRSLQRGRIGFTLLEITVSLVIVGMILAAGTALFLGLARGDDTIREASARFDRLANGEQWLGTLFLNVDARADVGSRFSGDSLEVSFVAWCGRVPNEPGRCRIALRLPAAGTTGGLMLRQGALRRRAEKESEGVMLRVVHRGAFRYLADARNGGRWTDRWKEAQPPAAVALIADGDTLFFPVGF